MATDICEGQPGLHSGRAIDDAIGRVRDAKRDEYRFRDGAVMGPLSDGGGTDSLLRRRRELLDRIEADLAELGKVDGDIDSVAIAWAQVGGYLD